ncbi:hypothetical protein XA68_17046 [Ophiocordyceps unilateralis]|uniref:Uncharacterized protein n=1 Tax=Ophiocordyceps unilateralis TaxID=268505 RepID=A0A2A9PKX6_OPHUN|nr:hypothetical protein XA68_17046 [Ophiocordyceps unilateralis]
MASDVASHGTATPSREQAHLVSLAAVSPPPACLELHPPITIISHHFPYLEAHRSGPWPDPEHPTPSCKGFASRHAVRRQRRGDIVARFCANHQLPLAKPADVAPVIPILTAAIAPARPVRPGTGAVSPAPVLLLRATPLSLYIPPRRRGGGGLWMFLTELIIDACRNFRCLSDPKVVFSSAGSRRHPIAYCSKPYPGADDALDLDAQTPGSSSPILCSHHVPGGTLHCASEQDGKPLFCANHRIA